MQRLNSSLVPRKRASRLGAGLLGLALAGCGGSNVAPGPSVTSTLPSTGTSSPATRAQVEALYVKSCSCHTATPPAGNLSLAQDKAYAATVNVKNAAGLTQILPGDAQNSYLYRKMLNTHLQMPGGSGTVMPLSGVLPQPELDLVRDWINAGALP